ncbi:MAG: hypothetical protein D6712_19390 [Chloroflexi bacterium]|nr:MAG: hypothetical protein D6712_19390 [Chloroflexota bacterium]
MRPSYRRLIIGVVIVLLVLIGIGYYVRVNIQTAAIPLGVPTGELLFLANREGDWDIYLLQTDGMALNLSKPEEDAPHDDYFPSWAMDGGVINFLSDKSGELAPAQILPNGTNRRDLSILEAILTLFTEGRFDWDPQWLADGRFVIASLRDFNLEVYLVSADGQTLTRLTESGARDWFPALSPDGEQLLFNSDRNGNEDIYLLNLNDTGATPIPLTQHEADDIRAVWSLDGGRILFISEREHNLESGVIDFYVMNADGSDLHPLGEDEIFEGGAVWSPDGEVYAFMSNRDGDFDLYLREGETTILLTDNTTPDLFPVWRPSGDDTENRDEN